MALLDHGNKNFGEWKLIGSGGFGNVYKARHKDLRKMRAIKILNNGVSLQSALKEAETMAIAPCEFVLTLYGMYQGCPPGEAISRLGIVMEFMDGGSVESLLKTLPGPPPWLFAFRLAYEVAVGMNYLHSRGLVHCDLKPSNVLLTDTLNAKIADFGLSKVSHSVLTGSRETTGEEGGSFKYMPPEAFELNYKPVRSFDIYSYGIVLWSIFTGEEPYPAANAELVKLKITEGDRPDCQKVEQKKAAELKELVGLMKKCWDGNASNRPDFKECTKVTEIVTLDTKHEKGINYAVFQVSKTLGLPTTIQGLNVTSQIQTPDQSQPHCTVDFGRQTQTERTPVQDPVAVPIKTMSEEEKAKFVDVNRATLIQDVSEVMSIVEELGIMVHGETYSKIHAKKPRQEKMRLLYNGTFRSGGQKVKVAFFDALNKLEPLLVERLGG